MDENFNTLEQEDLIKLVKYLLRKVKELEAEILRIRKLLQQ